MSQGQYGQKELLLRPSLDEGGHYLRWVVPPIAMGGSGGGHRLFGFALFIQNEAVQAKFSPHRPDSFLLLSPGPDLIYGTADDVANFSHNGAELRPAHELGVSGG